MEQIIMFFRRNRNVIMCSDNIHGVIEIARFNTGVSDKTVMDVAKKFMRDTYSNDKIVQWYRLDRVNEIICIHKPKDPKGGFSCFLKKLFKI